MVLSTLPIVNAGTAHSLVRSSSRNHKIPSAVFMAMRTMCFIDQQDAFLPASAVLPVRDRFEMTRIDAAPLAAKMIEHEAGGQYTSGHCEREPMGHYVTDSDLEHTVAFPVLGAHPKPASGIRLRRNELHKAVDWCETTLSHVTPFKSQRSGPVGTFPRLCRPVSNVANAANRSKRSKVQ
jgi:hypothetical protein